MKTGFLNGGTQSNQRAFILPEPSPEIFIFNKQVNCLPTAQLALSLKDRAFTLPINGVKVTFTIKNDAVK